MAMAKLGFSKSVSSGSSLALPPNPKFNPLLPAHVKWTHKKNLVVSCQTRIDLPKLRAKDFHPWITHEPKVLKIAAILVELYDPIIRIHLIAAAIYVFIVFVKNNLKSLKETATPPAPKRRTRSPAAKKTQSAAAAQQSKYQAQLLQLAIARIDALYCIAKVWIRLYALLTSFDSQTYIARISRKDFLYLLELDRALTAAPKSAEQNRPFWNKFLCQALQVIASSISTSVNIKGKMHPNCEWLPRKRVPIVIDNLEIKTSTPGLDEFIELMNKVDIFTLRKA